MNDNTLATIDEAQRLLDGAAAGHAFMSTRDCNACRRGHCSEAMAYSRGRHDLDERAPALARTVIAQAAELARAREDNDIVHAGRNVVHGTLERRIATVEAERDRAREAVIALTAIVEGRTTAPTEAEIALHAERNGMWSVCPLGEGKPRFTLVPDLSYLGVCRVIPFDSDWCPCAWPVAGGSDER